MSVVNALILPLLLVEAGVKPTVPNPVMLTFEDSGFDKSINLMVGQEAYNVIDKITYRRTIDGIEIVPNTKTITELIKSSYSEKTRMVDWIKGNPPPDVGECAYGELLEGFSHLVVDTSEGAIILECRRLTESFEGEKVLLGVHNGCIYLRITESTHYIIIRLFPDLSIDTAFEIGEYTFASGAVRDIISLDFGSEFILARSNYGLSYCSYKDGSTIVSNSDPIVHAKEYFSHYLSVIQSDGKVVFTDGYKVYRLDDNCVLDATFTTFEQTDWEVGHLYVGANDCIYVTLEDRSEGYSIYDNDVVKLNSNGVLDSSFTRITSKNSIQIIHDDGNELISVHQNVWGSTSLIINRWSQQGVQLGQKEYITQDSYVTGCVNDRVFVGIQADGVAGFYYSVLDAATLESISSLGDIYGQPMKIEGDLLYLNNVMFDSLHVFQLGGVDDYIKEIDFSEDNRGDFKLNYLRALSDVLPDYLKPKTALQELEVATIKLELANE